MRFKKHRALFHIYCRRIISVEVGEYVNDQGCSLPKLSVPMPGVPATKVEGRVACDIFSKKKDTWYDVPGYVEIPNTIQPQEYSMGSGTEGMSHRIATRMATATCAICTGMMIAGTGTTTGSTTTGMCRTPRFCSQLSFFLSC